MWYRSGNCDDNFDLVKLKLVDSGFHKPPGAVLDAGVRQKVKKLIKETFGNCFTSTGITFEFTT